MQINVEVIKNNIEKLGLLYQTDFVINGQQAIDKTKKLLDDALKSESKNIKPISLMLLDFQMPLKNGI